ncbi:MAG: hypothetical protein ACRYGR_06600 [Janthinobacterium lividum]
MEYAIKKIATADEQRVREAGILELPKRHQRSKKSATKKFKAFVGSDDDDDDDDHGRDELGKV